MKSFAFSLLVAFGIVAGIGASVPATSPPIANPESPVITQTEGLAVKGETSVAVGDTVVLTPTDADGCDIAWLPIEGMGLIEKMVQTKEKRAIVNDDLEFIDLPISSIVFKPSKAGEIRFVCTAIDFKNDKFFQVIHSVTVTGGEEEKKDDKDDKTPPKPDPDDGPKGWVKSDYLVLVYESEASSVSVEVAGLTTSKLWLTDISAAGLNRPLVYDKDSDEAKVLIANAKAMSLESDIPFMAVMDKDGKFKRTMPVLFGDDLKKELGLL